MMVQLMTSRVSDQRIVIASYLDPRSVKGRNVGLAGVEYILQLGNVHLRRRCSQDRNTQERCCGILIFPAESSGLHLGTRLFTEPKRLMKPPVKGKGVNSSLLGTVFPPQFELAQALDRTEVGAPVVGALTDPAVRSGKGRGRGREEGLMRNSCCLPTEQMESLNITPPFISSSAKSRFTLSVTTLFIVHMNENRMMQSHRALLLASLFFPAVGVHATLMS